MSSQSQKSLWAMGQLWIKHGTCIRKTRYKKVKSKKEKGQRQIGIIKANNRGANNGVKSKVYFLSEEK